MKTKTYKIHPLLDNLPMADGATYEKLKADIAQNGQITPIFTYQGKIFNGRHRYKICQELGIEPWVQEVTEHFQELEWTEERIAKEIYADTVRVSKPWGASQRAMWWALHIGNQQGNKASGKKSSKEVTSSTVDEVVEKPSRSLIANANFIIRASENAIPMVAKKAQKLIQSVEKGEISVKKARKELDVPTIKRASAEDALREIPKVYAFRSLFNLLNTAAKSVSEDAQALPLVESAWHHYKLLVDAGEEPLKAQERVMRAIAKYLEQTLELVIGSDVFTPENLPVSKSELALWRSTTERRRDQFESGKALYNDSHLKPVWAHITDAKYHLDLIKRGEFSKIMASNKRIPQAVGAADSQTSEQAAGIGKYPPLFAQKYYLEGLPSQELILLYLEGFEVMKGRFKRLNATYRKKYNAETYFTMRFGFSDNTVTDLRKKAGKEGAQITMNVRKEIIRFLTAETGEGLLLV